MDKYSEWTRAQLVVELNRRGMRAGNQSVCDYMLRLEADDRFRARHPHLDHDAFARAGSVLTPTLFSRKGR